MKWCFSPDNPASITIKHDSNNITENFLKATYTFLYMYMYIDKTFNESGRKNNLK